MRWGRFLSLAADAYGSLFLIAAGGFAGGFIASLVGWLAFPASLEFSRGIGWILGAGLAAFGVSTGRLRFYGDRWMTGQSWRSSVKAETIGHPSPPNRTFIPWTRTLSTLTFLAGLGAVLGGIGSCSFLPLWGSLLMSPASRSVLALERLAAGQIASETRETVTTPLPSSASSSPLNAALAPLSQSNWQIPFFGVVTVAALGALAGLGLGIYADQYERRAAAASRQNPPPNPSESD